MNKVRKILFFAKLFIILLFPVNFAMAGVSTVKETKVIEIQTLLNKCVQQSNITLTKLQELQLLYGNLFRNFGVIEKKLEEKERELSAKNAELETLRKNRDELFDKLTKKDRYVKYSLLGIGLILLLLLLSALLGRRLYFSKQRGDQREIKLLNFSILTIRIFSAIIIIFLFYLLYLYFRV